MTACRRWPYITMKTQDKGQFSIILHRAYLLNFLLFLTFSKLSKIMLLSKPNSIAEFECLRFKPSRNDSLQKMAIIHHENSKRDERANQLLVAGLATLSHCVGCSVGQAVCQSFPNCFFGILQAVLASPLLLNCTCLMHSHMGNFFLLLSSVHLSVHTYVHPSLPRP